MHNIFMEDFIDCLSIATEAYVNTDHENHVYVNPDFADMYHELKHELCEIADELYRISYDIEHSPVQTVNGEYVNIQEIVELRNAWVLIIEKLKGCLTDEGRKWDDLTYDVDACCYEVATSFGYDNPIG